MKEHPCLKCSVKFNSNQLNLKFYLIFFNLKVLFIYIVRYDEAFSKGINVKCVERKTAFEILKILETFFVLDEQFDT